jgi:hypothetical protein
LIEDTAYLHSRSKDRIEIRLARGDAFQIVLGSTALVLVHHPAEYSAEKRQAHVGMIATMQFERLMSSHSLKGLAFVLPRLIDQPGRNCIPSSIEYSSRIAPRDLLGLEANIESSFGGSALLKVLVSGVIMTRIIQAVRRTAGNTCSMVTQLVSTFVCW